MNSNAPKDNANPVIRAVDNRSKHLEKKRHGWDELQRISCCTEEGNSNRLDPSFFTASSFNSSISRCPEDIAVMQALADVSICTEGTGVSLLRQAGVKIASTPEQLSFPPSFTRQDDTKAAEDNRQETELNKRDVLDVDEVYDIIRNIQDPEHPLTLEQLGVVSRMQINVHDTLDSHEHSNKAPFSSLQIRFTPTVPHCSMATLIGLAIRVKLHRSLPSRFKVKVSIEPGTHQSETAVNKQLDDKERVRAALENPHLLKIVNKCIADGMKMSAV